MKNRIVEIHVKNIFYSLLGLMLISILGIYMGITALDFVQEEPWRSTSMIGYNRDWLVAAIPFFCVSAVISLFLLIFCLIRYKK